MGSRWDHRALKSRVDKLGGTFSTTRDFRGPKFSGRGKSTPLNHGYYYERTKLSGREISILKSRPEKKVYKFPPLHFDVVCGHKSVKISKSKSGIVTKILENQVKSVSNMVLKFQGPK